MGNYFSYISLNKYVNIDKNKKYPFNKFNKFNKFNRYKNEPFSVDYLHNIKYIPTLNTIKE